jgi:hypothetical protein
MSDKNETNVPAISAGELEVSAVTTAEKVSTETAGMRRRRERAERKAAKLTKTPSRKRQEAPLGILTISSILVNATANGLMNDEAEKVEATRAELIRQRDEALDKAGKLLADKKYADGMLAMKEAEELDEKVSKATNAIRDVAKLDREAAAMLSAISASIRAEYYAGKDADAKIATIGALSLDEDDRKAIAAFLRHFAPMFPKVGKRSKLF